MCGLDAEGYGALGAVLAVGAVLGALAVASLGNAPRKGRNSLHMQILLGATVLAFAASTSVWAAVPVLLIYGGAILAVFTMMTSLVQLNVSEEMRGRIMSVHNTAFRGAMPLSNVTCGFAAERIGAGSVLSISGVVLIAVALWYKLSGNKVNEL